MKGWVKTPRDITNQPWYTKSGMFHLYSHCCLKADYTTGILKTSRKSLVVETGLTEWHVRAGLKELEDTGFLEISSSKKCMVITICEQDSCDGAVSKFIQVKPISSKVSSKQNLNNTSNQNSKLSSCKKTSYENSSAKVIQDKNEKSSKVSSPSLKEDIKKSKDTSVSLHSKNKTKQNNTKENPDGFFPANYFDNSWQLNYDELSSFRKRVYDELGEATSIMFCGFIEDLVRSTAGDLETYRDSVITHYVETYCKDLLFTNTKLDGEGRSRHVINWIKVRYSGEYAETNILQDIVAYEIHNVFGKTISADKAKRSKLRYLVKAMRHNKLDDLNEFLNYCKITKPSNIPDIVDYLLNVSSGFQLLHHEYKKHIFGRLYRYK